MNECFFCGVSGEKVRLFQAIGDEGIILVCENCAFDEGIPIIRKPTTFQLKVSEKEPEKKVSEALARARDPKEIERKKELARKEEEKKLQNLTLKDIVDKNYQKKIQKSSGKPRVKLMDNFHWILMRARRSKKLSQQQLAEAISESEVAIKMAEQGIMPEDDFRLVNKLENFLSIRIRQDINENLVEGERDKLLREKKKQPIRIIDFKKDMVEDLKIADLKRMREHFSGDKNLEMLRQAEKEALEDEYEESKENKLSEEDE